MADSTFPEVDVNNELYPGSNRKVEVDPISSEIATSKAIKEKEEECERKKKQREKCDALHKLKTTIVVSAIVVAVAGAAFAINKKLREK